MGIIDKYTGFDWNEGNSLKNWLKHGVTQEEIEEAFSNDPFFVFDDILHSREEERRIILSKTNAGGLLFGVYTIRKNRVRPICVRPANKKERKQYDEEIKRNPKISK